MVDQFRSLLVAVVGGVIVSAVLLVAGTRNTLQLLLGFGLGVLALWLALEVFNANFDVRRKRPVTTAAPEAEFEAELANIQRIISSEPRRARVSGPRLMVPLTAAELIYLARREDLTNHEIRQLTARYIGQWIALEIVVSDVYGNALTLWGYEIGTNIHVAFNFDSDEDQARVKGLRKGMRVKVIGQLETIDTGYLGSRHAEFGEWPPRPSPTPDGSQQDQDANQVPS